MVKDAVVHMYNRKPLSHKKEPIWVSSGGADEPRTYYIQWSKLEREKQILYISVYVWNLERWYWWIYLQDSSADADIENSLMDKSRGENGEGEMNGESSMEAYTLPYVT